MGDPRRHLQRRARLAALHLGEHRRADPGSLGQITQRQIHRLAQGAHTGAEALRGRGWLRRGHRRAYVITYKRLLRPLRRSGQRRPARPRPRLASARCSRPDVLVLGGGGVLGEAWMMGVLAGIEDGAGFDLRACESFVGTSAGAIVAAHLVAGNAPRRPSSVGTELRGRHGAASRGLAVAAVAAARRAGQAALAASATFAPLALGVAAPGGALVRALLLRGLPRPPDTLSGLRAQVERSGARFDGRLRVTAVDRGSGRRVVFGSPGAPGATRRRGGRGVVHGPVAVRAGPDRRARVRRRRGLESHQPRRRARRPRHPRAVPEPDGQPHHPPHDADA